MPKLSAVLNDAAYQEADESLKTLYVQNTDTKEWWLDVDEPGRLDVNGSKTLQNKKDELKRIHDEVRTLKADLAAYQSLGNPDDLKTALEANQPEAVTEMVNKHRQELDTLKRSFEEPLTAATERAKRLEQQVQQSIVESEINRLRDTHGLNDAANFTLRDYLKPVPVEDGGDKYQIRVFQDGQEAAIAGQPMTPDQLIKRFQEEKKFPWMFNAGDGGGPGKVAQNTGGHNKFEGLRGTAKLQAAREQGL